MQQGRVACSHTLAAETSDSVTQAGGSSAEAASSAQRSELLLSCQVVSGMQYVSAEEWDACATGSGEVNPFLLHSFLSALEDSGSAVKEEGWLPQHVLVREEGSRRLLGCCPLYLKGHSYGEYVFDHAWANAASQLGQRYYPKLQSCVPFTPVTGPRLLVAPGAHAAAVSKAMADTLLTLAEEYKVSSLHVTFSSAEEWAQLGEQGYLRRTGIQYHWPNPGYASFDDFLAALKQPKRKNIRQERKQVAASGLRVRRLTGADIQPHHWDAFYSFYINTTDRKWGQAYLTREFFLRLGASLADRVMLVTAHQDDTAAPRPPARAGRRPQPDGLVAGALNLVGSHALFGRNWGCAPGLQVKHLHFEVCYYQALEAAIERRLPRVEAGAQGEHKIQRGYLPSPTFSAHWLAQPDLRNAVDGFLRRERAQVAYTLAALRAEASPYKELPPSQP